MAPGSARGPGRQGRLGSWLEPGRVGAGLRNLGNTCYANAALQCLTHTPPLAGYLLSRRLAPSCPCRPLCALCAMQAHVSRALRRPGEVVWPQEELLAGFHAQQQEDAHEFLMFTLDALQRACPREPAPCGLQPRAGTAVQQLFGGQWRSQVECARCRRVSTTLEPFLDVALDIQAAHSVEQALQQLGRPETLAGADAYHCAACGDKGPAAKTLALHSAPQVLILVLKRFCGLTGDKLARPVRYPQRLDLRASVSRQRPGGPAHELYAVLVHAGEGWRQGHYLCYVRAGEDQWYRMDDAAVTSCAASAALSQQAYVLFYVQDSEADGARGQHGGPAPGPPSPGAGLRPGARREPAGDQAREPEQETPTRPLTLGQWRQRQEHARPQPALTLREVERALPADAVVIHRPRRPAGPGEGPSAGKGGRPPPSAEQDPLQGPAPVGRAPGTGGRARAAKGKNRKARSILLAF
ncbi:Ubiquitin carboxyl-terminal hydrolase 17-like protein 22 [Galemys pyrenaicus]|uniref:Ubiquitin carboxyl-terminal hydrolase 17-like protein 22 n=1 Tax=Galemys pyrenaicus TaxID=202257 RepID=A0A8J5ZII8_GALPY|nr:Ubiquitin carboxyl-terminal hydrolase 17-like protein 22 [Galemys pyrenaicus]KAG8506332.1 Ubiquitin carboxyl-terminal hydrolase 17-like protein 22 [Galemys pyrenaicus]